MPYGIRTVRRACGAARRTRERAAGEVTGRIEWGCVASLCRPAMPIAGSLIGRVTMIRDILWPLGSSESGAPPTRRIFASARSPASNELIRNQFPLSTTFNEIGPSVPWTATETG
jgi:hypothetical protein